MEYIFNNDPTDTCIRLVYKDRVVTISLDRHTTLGSVAELSRDLEPAHYGNLVDVTVPRVPAVVRLPDFMPANFMFHDNPMADFEDLLSPRSGHEAPAYAASFKS